MGPIYAALMVLFIAAIPAFAQGQPSVDDIIAKMRSQLDLQEDQITNITPIIEKYSIAFQDLQKSISDGTINPSAIDSQRQGIEAAETQELSPYLKPYQLSEWNNMQGQIYQQKDKDDSGSDANADGDADADRYTNLPGS